MPELIKLKCILLTTCYVYSFSGFQYELFKQLRDINFECHSPEEEASHKSQETKSQTRDALWFVTWFPDFCDLLLLLDYGIQS